MNIEKRNLSNMSNDIPLLKSLQFYLPQEPLILLQGIQLQFKLHPNP